MVTSAIKISVDKMTSAGPRATYFRRAPSSVSLGGARCEPALRFFPSAAIILNRKACMRLMPGGFPSLQPIGSGGGRPKPSRRFVVAFGPNAAPISPQLFPWLPARGRFCGESACLVGRD